MVCDVGLAEEDESATARREKDEQRQRRRLLQSTMLQELREEISDRPEEVRTLSFVDVFLVGLLAALGTG
jgi:hypothetical protein